ncbi:MAG: DNA primase [Fidelibacterota bacterium]
MAKIPLETIDRIRDNADILAVVSRHVNLKKRGRNYFGICPFHHEKTASFSVAPDKGIYHCFGCGAGGNAINFIMEFEKVSFVEAVKQLGSELGIPIQFTGSDDSREFFSALYEIHQLAVEIYAKTLFSERGAEALTYLLERGINRETLALFKIGFAPDRNDFLQEAIRLEQFSPEVLEKCGLFGKSEKGYYDRFKARIMFPISNSSGKVIAFGGRIFGTEEGAKYINSPETPLYHKSDVFYGLHLSRDSIRREQAAILVEGYTDLIQLFQAGLKNVVAVSGTAFTDRHAQQIRKITSKVYLAYDGDSAGIKATLRAGYSLLKGGVEPLVVPMPQELDPDEWIQSKGPDGFRKAMETQYLLLDFHLSTLDLESHSSTEKSNLVKEILGEIVEVNDPIIQRDFFKKLSQVLGVDESQIIHLFKQQVQKRRPRTETVSPRLELELFTSTTAKAELALVQVLAGEDQEAKALVKEQLDINLIRDELLKKIARLLVGAVEIDPSELVGHFETARERDIVTKILMEADQLINMNQLVRDCLRTLKRQPLKDEIRSIRLKIRELEAAGKDTTELLLKLAELQQKLRPDK